MRESINLRNTIVVCMIAWCSCVAAQTVQITGQVLNPKGKPVPGTNVLVKGTSNGTAVDADGNFTLSVPEGTSTVLFAFIGYKKYEQELKIEKGVAYHVRVTLVKRNIYNIEEKSSGEVIRQPLPKLIQ